MTICPICLEYLVQPGCCVPCGHLYCNQCISDWRNGHNNRCPECRESITTVQSIYLDTESIRELIVERTRLNDSVNELTATIENLRQNPSIEGNHRLHSEVEEVQTLNAALLSDIGVLNLELKRANIRNRSSPPAKDNSVARLAIMIFLIFTSVCFLYLGVCIFTEWFSEKPDYLEEVVVRHLRFLSESNTYITSTFSSVASYVPTVISLSFASCIIFLATCPNIIDSICFAIFNFAMGSFLVLLMCICVLFDAVLISTYLLLFICIGSLFFLKTLR